MASFKHVAGYAMMALVWLVTAGASAQVAVSGVVQDGVGAPIANALVEFSQSAVVIADDVSAIDGSYSVSLPVGSYDVKVTPEQGSGFLQQSQDGLVFGADATFNLVLVAPAQIETYSGTVRDRAGSGVSDVRVELFDGDGFFDDTTDGDGSFLVSSTPNVNEVELRRTFPGDLLPSTWNVRFPDVDLSAGPVSDASLVLEDRVLSGMVTNDLGQPVADAQLAWDQEVSYGAASGHARMYATTNDSGAFTIAVLPGSGSLSVLPPVGSGLHDQAVNVVVPDQLADPAAVMVVLEEAVLVSYAGAVIDRTGTGVSGVRVELFDGEDFYENTTDGSGAFDVMSTSGLNEVEIRRMFPGDILPSSWSVRFPDVDLSSGAVSGASLVLEDRVLSGVVLDDQQQPVADAQLAWDQEVDYGSASGHARMYATTNAQGQFTIAALPGNGNLSVVPPAGSGLHDRTVAVVVPDQVADPDAQNVVLEAVVLASYAGTVVDRMGNGVDGVRVELFDGHDFYEDTTDGSGAFAVMSTPTVNEVEVRRTFQSGSLLPSSWNLRFPEVDLGSGPVAGASLVLEDRVLSGVVTDIDGLPVSNVQLSWDQQVGYASVTGSARIYATTNAQGQFTIAALPGTGSLNATLQSGSGFTPVSLSNVTVTDDQSFAVLVQFESESITSTVVAGGTLTSDGEGDGATPADPLETSVTITTAGSVTILERSVTTTPPAGVVFLTQEVSISAPGGSAAQPLTLVFVLDASRVPEDVTPESFDVFRNGALAPSCVGSPGQASPDPCVAERSLLAGGDLRFTVLTSMASVWNLGIADPSGPCGNNVLDAGEDCDDGNSVGGDCCSATCAFEVSGASCDDGDLCTTGDSCDGAGTCDAGTSQVVCTALGSCYDVGVCDPASGACSNPPKTAGASCGDGTDDACTDPDSCDGAGQCESHDVAGCCLSDGDCNDGDACTTDSCAAGNVCSHASIGGCCLTNSECDDGEACTTDACNANACESTVITGCGEPDVTDMDAGSDEGDAGREWDASVQADAAVPGGPDAGNPDGQTDAGFGDAGLGEDNSDGGCQCTMARGQKSAPLSLLAFGLLLAMRLSRRRKRG